MSLYKKLKPYIRTLKIATAVTGASVILGYSVFQTCVSINNIVNSTIVIREQRDYSDYIYVTDQNYEKILIHEYYKEYKKYSGISRWFRLYRHKLSWRLLWISKNGNEHLRNIALEELVSLNIKDWDYLKLAQALDCNTAVLLARTEDADLRFFLPPPMHIRKAAMSPELLCYKFGDMLTSLLNIDSHSCIEHFLSKYFVNVQEQAVDTDILPAKPDRLSDKDLCLMCLNALYHHLSVVKCDETSRILPNDIAMDLFPRIAELMLRNPNDVDIDGGVLRVLTVLSVDKTLLNHFFQNGLIRELTRLIKSTDVCLSSSAAVCLSNLSGECTYRPGLFLLYPIYRTGREPVCDTLLVHGLRGGVFVTWRQRDPICSKSSGFPDEINTAGNDCQPLGCNVNENPSFLDPEVRKLIEEITELKEEILLENYEVVLHDIPERTERDFNNTVISVAYKKRNALNQENEDRCSHTSCWPKEWLSKDCKNLRILGVNYWSSLSEWIARCPYQVTDIESRAAQLLSKLKDAKVGTGGTPLVWLAHSMGGLIVKQLLISCAHNATDDSNELCKNTKAILFFSTPHKGSTVATMPRAVAAVFWPSNDVRQLQENSPELHEIQDAFIKRADEHNWETISFGESRPTLVTAFKVPFHLVKPQSADLGRGPFYELPLDHVYICKPATRQSVLYLLVLDVLHRVTNQVKESNFKNKIESSNGIISTFFCKLQGKPICLDTDEEVSGFQRFTWIERFILNLFSDDE